MYQTTKILERSKLRAGRDHYVQFPIQGSEILALVFRILVTDASVGMDNLNPTLVTFEQSWTEGKTWEQIPYFFEPIEGDGEWKGEPASTTPRLAPLGRLKIVLPAGEQATFEIFKPRLDMRDVYTYSSSDLTVTSSMGFLIDGMAEDVGIDTTTPTENIVLPVSLHGGQGEPELVVKVLEEERYIETEAERSLVPTISTLMAFEPESGERKELESTQEGALKVTEVGYLRTFTHERNYLTSPFGSGIQEIMTPLNFIIHKLDVFDSSGEPYFLELYNLETETWELAFVPPGGVSITFTTYRRIRITRPPLQEGIYGASDSGYRLITFWGEYVTDAGELPIPPELD